ncbi:MAG: RluA family pseudouridine synthase [Firmicutes bacterium]|nr:RluA family pseudouridine synthase [Bacillota bacterium]MBR6969768.1 RluA family pseudouridine synthase [Bacillota bacterium]
MENAITYVWTKEDEGLYVKEVLQRRFAVSSRLMRKIKVSGQIALDGRAARLRDKGRTGQTLTVAFPEESSYFEPEDIPLDVVYEDSDLLVVNKQPFLVVHPTKNYQSGTLANALAYRLREKGERWKIRFINRLDRDTSGLVLVAKNGHAQDAVSSQMEKGTTVKKYLALVHGLFEGPEGRIDLPIDKDPDHKARRMVREDGYPSVTLYKVLQSWDVPDLGPDFKPWNGEKRIEGYSLVELTLLTGRTHQIRVHMTHLGHPIAGDELYGQLYGYEAGTDVLDRQALHACSLKLAQPMTGDPIELKTAMPADMAECIERIEHFEH